jgi:hypothetical protein
MSDVRGDLRFDTREARVPLKSGDILTRAGVINDAVQLFNAAYERMRSVGQAAVPAPVSPVDNVEAPAANPAQTPVEAAGVLDAQKAVREAFGDAA